MWVGGWGVDGGWMPLRALPTSPQRYCDPASLVFLYSLSIISYKYRLSFIFFSIWPEMPDLGRSFVTLMYNPLGPQYYLFIKVVFNIHKHKAGMSQKDVILTVRCEI